MKSAPESQALAILRILRCNNEPETILPIIQASRSSRHCSSTQEWLSLSTSRLGLECELISSNPVSFPPLQRFESNILKTVGNLATDDGEASQSSSVVGVSVASDSEANPFCPHSPPNSPISTFHLCDERLEDLNITFWTSVSIPNDLAARIISLYLETDHPLLGAFDPNLFIDGLVNYHLSHCSKLLVSALMYWGCQMYSASAPEVRGYLPRFCEEAEKRWSDEKATDSLPNLAGMQLLGLAYLGDGKDHCVLTYVTEANAMGTRMGLFGVKTEEVASKSREITPELQIATSYAAWGTFNWIVLMALFYQQPGLAYPEYPPRFPIPGHSRHRSRGDSAKPVRESLQSTYMGGTFPVLCCFWRIIHEVILRYYRDQHGRLSDHVSLTFAEYKYRELIAWAETLPPFMIRSEKSPHHVLTFHIWLHAAILDILRPFTTQARSASKPFKLETFTCKIISPDAAYKASVNQLKRLVVVYRNNYATSTDTMLWHTALIYITNATLDNSEDPTWPFYLVFSIQCYKSLRQSYRFAEAIGRSLISLAMQKRDLSAIEARRMTQKFEEGRLSKPSDDIRATFMADLRLAMTDPQEASVETLASGFEDIALFQEFTKFTNKEDSSEDKPMEDETVAWERL
ncbi:hypothetical protein Forpe1208_v003555 [Fusarium oxysporum f. sp. rapae]|uniref:Nitrogen assimilation transcription factor nit-4 n=1 Tax=Fusarium oxysporum f. sp. rapae TaxID=485398 RepID=A0A8J5UCH1_FUSOX|nr:hypothetical protein Forpe1208_v003555 [Fusarium oxysporum f. sp. rapae]